MADYQKPTATKRHNSATASGRPYIPTSGVTSPDNYGRIDAENESNLHVLSAVASPRRSSVARPRLNNRRKRPHSPDPEDMMPETTSNGMATLMPNSTSECPLLMLPAELIDAILMHLDPVELVTVSASCRVLHRHAVSDVHWQGIVQDNIPGVAVTTPGPFRDFRELYATHHNLWFLPRHKIWFGDVEPMGRLVIARFDPQTACIEAHQLVVACQKKTYQEWDEEDSVIIHDFEAKALLHEAKPILRFMPGQGPNGSHFKRRANANDFFDELPVPLDDRSEGIFHNLSFARALDAEVARDRLASSYPYNNVWPPPTIPARDHIQGCTDDEAERPRARKDASEQAFRMRNWIEFSGTIGVRMGEDIASFSTLDPKLYTPTKERPYRGIWTGDYSGHGFEFLLLHQPDEPPASNSELGLVRAEEETEEEWERRCLHARVNRGRLEAIKLTGDPNIPRGEYTFVADDLGPGGYVRHVHDPAFMSNDPEGTRVVKSKGHVALTGFIEDKFIESQLILISNDRLAQYWVEFGHISFFQRVDVDALLAV